MANVSGKASFTVEASVDKSSIDKTRKEIYNSFKSLSTEISRLMSELKIDISSDNTDEVIKGYAKVSNKINELLQLQKKLGDTDPLRGNISSSISGYVKNLENAINKVKGLNLSSKDIFDGISNKSFTNVPEFDKVSKLSEAMNQFKASVNELQSSFGKVGQLAGKAFNGVSSAVNTVDYKINDLKNSISKNLSSALNTVSKPFKSIGSTVSKGLAPVGNVLSSIGKKFVSFGTNIKNSTKGVASSLKGVASSTLNVAKNSSFLNNVKNAFSSIKKTVDGVKNSVNGLIPSFKNAGAEASKVAKATDSFNKASTSSGGLFSSIAGGVTVGNLASQAITGVASSLKDFAQSAIEAGSSFESHYMNVRRVFGDSKDIILDYSKSSIDALNMSESAYMQGASQIGSLLGNYITDTDQLAQVTNGLVSTVADYKAAYSNFSEEEVLTKILSGLRGETEAIQDLGVSVKAVDMQAFLDKAGIDATWESLSEGEQTLYRVQYLLQQSQATGVWGLASAQTDTFNGQLNRLKANWESLKTTVGSFLTAVLTPLLKFVNGLLSRLVDLANMFAETFGGDKYDLAESSTSGGSPADSAIQGYKNAESAIDDAATAQDGLTEATDDGSKAADKNSKAMGKEAAEAKKSLAPFHELNILQKDKASGSGGSGGSGYSGGSGGSGGGSGGGAGGVGGFLDSAIEKIGSDEGVSKTDKLADMFDRVASAFRGFIDGFNKGIEGARFDEFGQQVLRLGKNLKDIFTDPEIVEEASKLLYNLQYLIGDILASIITILVSWGTDMLEVLNQDIENNIEEIKSRILGLLQGLNEAIVNAIDIVDIIREILTNADVSNAVGEFMARLVETFVISAYSLANVGVELANALLGGIRDALVETKDTIIENLVQGFDGINAGIKIANEVILGISDALANILSSEAFNNAITAVVSAITIAFTEAFAFLGTVFGDLADTIFAPILERLPLIQEGFISFIESITPLLEMFKTMVTDAFTTINRVYEENIKPSLDLIKASFGEWLDWLGATYDKYIAPLISRIVSGIVDFYNSTLQPTLDSIASLVGNVIEIITHLITDVLIPVIMTIADGILPILKAAFEVTFEAAKLVAEAFTTSIGGIADILNALLEFFMNVFKGDFEGAWNSLKDNVGKYIDKVCNYLGKLKDALLAIVNYVKDKVLGVFDSFGDKIESIKEKASQAVDFVKGAVSTATSKVTGIFDKGRSISSSGMAKASTFSANSVTPAMGVLATKSIPKLARGAVIKPNSEFLAVLGDQRTGTNIESPLSTIEQAFRNVMSEFSNTGDQPVIVNVKIGEDSISDFVYNTSKRNSYKTNGR